MLIDSATVGTILNVLRTKYLEDNRLEGCHDSIPIRIAMFEPLPSRNYELYHSSLSRIVRKGGQFPVLIEKPFRYRSSKNRDLAYFGFHVRSPELMAFRQELAKDFKDFIRDRVRLRKMFINNKDRNLHFRPKIMVLPKIPAATAMDVEQELRQSFPGIIATCTALGFELEEKYPKGSEVKEKIREEFLFRK